jgi:CRP-like cAMP-binding protein
MVANSALASSLAFHGQPLLVPRGSVVFDADEPADGAYIVRSGLVAVLLLNENGDSIWSRTVPEYGIVGLSAAIGRHMHCVRALASVDSELIFIPTATLARVISEQADLGSQVLAVIADELGDLRRKATMLNGRFRPTA